MKWQEAPGGNTWCHRNETCKFLTNAIAFTGRGKKAPHHFSFMLKSLFFRPLENSFHHTLMEMADAQERQALSEPRLLSGLDE